VPSYVEGFKAKILENIKLKRFLSSTLYYEFLAELFTVSKDDSLERILHFILEYLRASVEDNEFIWKQLILAV
jgi:hypothetical protein